MLFSSATPGDALYIFAISLLLYRAIRGAGVRARLGKIVMSTDCEGTPQVHLGIPQPPPPSLNLNVIFYPESDFLLLPVLPKFSEPESSLTSVDVDIARTRIDGHELHDDDIDIEHCALSFENDDWDVDDGGTADDDVDVNDAHSDVSLTSVVLHLVILLTRSLDTSHSLLRPTIFRRTLVAYEYVVTLATLLVLVVKSRKRCVPIHTEQHET